MPDPCQIYTDIIPIADIADIGGINPISVIGSILGLPPCIEPTPKKSNVLKKPEAKPYFLKPDVSTDYFEFRGAIREARNITPLVDGVDIFIELETAITEASSSIFMGFWAFDPDMRAVSDPTKTWLDLLIDAAKRGVKVRLHFPDFDPGFTLINHYQAWNRFFYLLKKIETIKDDAFQVVCTTHEVEIPAYVLTIDTRVANFYTQLLDDLNAGQYGKIEKIYPNAPGLWDKFVIKLRSLKSGKYEMRFRNSKKTTFPLWPAVHHQKVLIVDSEVAYVGGINVLAPYIDTQVHDEKSQIRTGENMQDQDYAPWHDTFVKVEDCRILSDFINSFAGLWNKARIRMEDFLKQANRSYPGVTIWRTTTDLKEKDFPVKYKYTTTGDIPCQLLRTVSARGADLFGTPKTYRTDILDSYILAINQAQHFIYVENQYFREYEIGMAIIDRFKKKPQLNVIIVVPFALVEEEKDLLSEHGTALQYDILTMIKSKMGTKLGIFYLKNKADQPIYMHSKLLIVDDLYANMGSANGNPRSFRIDTELNVAWYDEKIVRDFRLNLWNEFLGSPTDIDIWKPNQFVSKWLKIAKSNRSIKDPAKRNASVFEFKSSDLPKGVKLDPKLAKFVEIYT